MKIKEIFDEIAMVSSTNKKVEILSKYQDNALLKRVLYLANSKRVKFYIKQIPDYTKFSERTTHVNSVFTLSNSLDTIEAISRREWTGNDAINELVGALSHIPDDDAYIIERIIDKDCKIGLGTTYINKVFPNLIEKTPYQGAISYDEKKARKIFEHGNFGYSQLKMDGRYCNAIIRSSEVELESRQGEPTILIGAKFIEELSNSFTNCVLNGELTMDGVSRYESNGIISSLIDITSKLNLRSEKETQRKIINFEDKHGNFESALNRIRFTVWDMIEVDEYFDLKSNTEYVRRFNALENILSESNLEMVSIVESLMVNSFEEAMNHFKLMLGRGEEGTILKDSKGLWKNGKPNYQIKMKLEMDVDLKIVGFNYGTKGSKNENLISSIDVESSCGLLKTSPAGINEDMMKFITNNQDNLLNTIVEVKCSGLSQDRDGNYSLLHPVFNRLRDDKDISDSLTNVIDNENMIKNLN